MQHVVFGHLSTDLAEHVLALAWAPHHGRVLDPTGSDRGGHHRRLVAHRDIAVCDADGFLYIRDRLKDMIISRGENVYPAEIEDVLLTHPGIADVAVLGMPSAKWGESPVAVVVRSDPGLDEAGVLAHCSGKLARFKLPKRAVFTDVIPRTSTGKALKRLLREQFPLDALE